ncbi:hypothetical protein MMC30_001892 [Trapelia coarctata]|nr:hypothetical protein [Trapelia coarctata]
MKTVLQLLGSAALFSYSHALATLKPGSIPYLTRVTNYTFHTLCERIHNPSLHFIEVEMYTIISAYDDDLMSYLGGHGPTDAGSTQGSEDNRLAQEALNLSRSSSSTAGTASSTTESKINCSKFESDLTEFAEVFQNMSYALSEKCHRQCLNKGYAWIAASNLQETFEYGYIMPFYVQVREIEAETGCRFNDTFLVEAERAIDYAKVWIETFQSLRTPCTDIGIRSKPKDMGGLVDANLELR